MRTVAAISVLLCAALCLVGGASGQERVVRGRVVDDQGQGLPGANVYLRGVNIGTISSSTGDFELPPVVLGSYELVCSFVGFEPVALRIDVPVEAPVICMLGLATIHSDEVVVTAARRPQLASEVPSSLSLISSEYLRSRRIETLDVAIKNTSGVQLQGNQVNIRGSSGFAYNTGSRVLLLLDGMPLLSPDTDGIPFEAFPLGQIRQIEILKGPGSALYGSGALGGVINLISRPVADKPVSNVRIAGGYYQPYRFREWTSRWPASKDGRFNWSFAGSHARQLSPTVGGWFSFSGRVDEGYLNRNRTRALNLFGKVVAQISDRTTLDVLGGFLSRRRDNFLFWNGLSDALNPGSIAISSSTDPSGSSDNQTTTYSLLPQLKTVLDASSVLTSRARLYALLIRPIDDDGHPKPLAQGTLGFRFGAETQYTRILSIGQITTGASVDANITRSSFFVSESGAESGRQPEAAAYVQAESQLSEHVSAVAGIRADVFWVSTIERIASVSPKLAVSYRLTDPTTIRASFGRGFRVPSIAERFTDDQSFFPIFRNLDLRPETSTSFEIGGRSVADLSGISVKADVSAFWYELSDLIEPRFVQQQASDRPRLLGFQFVNLDRGRVAGVELDVQLALLPNLAGHLGYTVLDSRDRATGLPLAYRPRHLVVAGSSVSRHRTSVSVDFRFASRPETIDSDFTRFVPDADILVRTVVTDVQLSHEFGVLSLAAGANNLFNYYYLDRPALLAAPREFVLQLSARF